MEKTNSSISNFKKFIFRFLLPSLITISAFLLLFDFAFEKFIIFKCEAEGSNKIYKNIHINNPNEIPIFGSSRAAGCYIPDLIDSNCFNYGIEKTQFGLLKTFLKNENNKNKTTPIIINFDYEIWENWIGDIANFIPNLNNQDIEQYVLDLNVDKPIYHIPGIRYFGYYQHYMKRYLGNHSSKSYLNKGGFFLLEKPSPGQMQREIKLRMKTKTLWVTNEQKEKRFIELITMDNRRKIFIVVAPYHVTYFRKLENLAGANLFLNELRQLPNVYVLDYSHVDYPDTLFKNTSHLNFTGARLFSEELKKKLNAIDSTHFK